MLLNHTTKLQSKRNLNSIQNVYNIKPDLSGFFLTNLEVGAYILINKFI
jgi:hypothetical protein